MLRWKSVPALLCLIGPATVVAQESDEPRPRGLFDRNTVREALDDARAQKKLAFVAVYSPDCEACRNSDEYTFHDTAVRNWLNKTTVSVKLMSDSEEGRNFVTAHHVKEFPSFFFLRPNGMKQGMIIGHLEPRAFFARGNSIVSGGPERSNSTSSIDVWTNRFEQGRTHLEEGNNVDALDIFIWALDHPPAHDPLYANERLKLVIDEMIALSRDLPEAKRELIERRDRAQEQILKTDAPLIIPMRIVQYVNQGFGLEEESIRMLDELRRKYPGGSNVDILSRLFYDQLLAARRYELLFGAATYSTNQAVVQEGEKSISDAQNAIRILAERYEILAGLGLGNESREAASAVFQLDSSPETFELLATHAVRSGRSYDDASAFLKESVKRVGKTLPRHTVLEAQIMSGNGQHEAAIKMLETAMESSTDDDTMVLYGNAIEALKKTGPANKGHRIPKPKDPGASKSN